MWLEAVDLGTVEQDVTVTGAGGWSVALMLPLLKCELCWIRKMNRHRVGRIFDLKKLNGDEWSAEA